MRPSTVEAPIAAIPSSSPCSIPGLDPALCKPQGFNTIPKGMSNGVLGNTQLEDDRGEPLRAGGHDALPGPRGAREDELADL